MLPDFTTALQMLLVDFCSNATCPNISSFGWTGLSLSSSGDIVWNGHRCVDYDRRVCSHCVCCCRCYYHPPSPSAGDVESKLWSSLGNGSPLHLRPLGLLKPLCKTPVRHSLSTLRPAAAAIFVVLIDELSRRDGRRVPRLRRSPLLRVSSSTRSIVYLGVSPVLITFRPRSDTPHA